MRAVRLLALVFTMAAFDARAQAFLDEISEALSFSALNDSVRVRVSGTLDLEYYYFDQPAPGLIYADDNNLFNPRLSVFADAQLGPHVYFFSQARVDRHFDPTEEGMQTRLDEYALRVTPWADGRLNVQVGKFAAVVGNWIPRHLSWDNPFITAPLVYENVTILEDAKALSPEYYLGGELRDPKYEYVPVLWGPSYASGASVAGRIGKFDYAGEIKNAALSSRPESWDVVNIGFEHPTFNGRVGFRPNEMWNFGFSASKGPFFRPEAEPTLPEGRGIGDYDQLVLAQDVSFAWRHLQVWAEFYETRFEVPLIGNADSLAYYIEAKYKLTPQLFVALRWNQQYFGDVEIYGSEIPWWHDISRVDAAVTYRLTEHTQLKVQFNVHHEEDRGPEYHHTVAAQLTVRF